MTILDSQGEPIEAKDARTCVVCRQVFDKTGPITYEPAWMMCDHWVCDDCQEKGPRLQRSEGRWCAGCAQEIRHAEHG